MLVLGCSRNQDWNIKEKGYGYAISVLIYFTYITVEHGAQESTNNFYGTVDKKRPNMFEGK
jgi:hypothetical protein